MPSYVAQTACDPHARPGTLALARLLKRTYPTSSYSTVYNCGTDGSVSEHYDGRAIDWFESARVPSQAAQASTAIKWLLATDKAGNQFAMVRRLGVQYIIWNGRIWGTWGGWQPYQNCLTKAMLTTAHDSYCHRNHVHISLTWNGALGRTTFWTNHLYRTNYGPCVAAGMNWAQDYVGSNYTRCNRTGTIAAAATASTVDRNLVKYSGAQVAYGDSGPIVSAVQAALHISQTGTFDASTRASLVAWQRAHHLSGTGQTDVPTWVALLAANNPR